MLFRSGNQGEAEVADGDFAAKGIRGGLLDHGPEFVDRNQERNGDEQRYDYDDSNEKDAKLFAHGTSGRIRVARDSGGERNTNTLKVHRRMTRQVTERREGHGMACDLTRNCDDKLKLWGCSSDG